MSTGERLSSFAGDDGVLFLRGEEGFAGRGELLRLDLPWAGDRLATALLEVSATLQGLRSSCIGVPVAFVSIPFGDTSPITAIVPRKLLVAEATGVSLRNIDGDGDPGPIDDSPRAVSTAPARYSVRPSRAPDKWVSLVGDAVDRISRGELDKVVLAREIVIEADVPFSQQMISLELLRARPTSYVFALDGFVGASPELLVERLGRRVKSLPLAGTFPRSSDSATDMALVERLRSSAKDRAEHAYLAEMVRGALQRYCEGVEAPETPEVVSLANVHHLATPISGTLTSEETGVLDLVAALHPTPAIGGRPTDVALRLIEELEQLDRGRYAGAVGWVDADGNGCFAVAIRAAQIEGRVASVIAGNGIVASSIPQRELEETRWKLQVMLSALIRP